MIMIHCLLYQLAVTIGCTVINYDDKSHFSFGRGKRIYLHVIPHIIILIKHYTNLHNSKLFENRSHLDYLINR